MQQSKLFIKGMVCNLYVMTVSNTLQNLGYILENVSLGEVNFQANGREVDVTKIEENENRRKAGTVWI